MGEIITFSTITMKYSEFRALHKQTGRYYLHCINRATQTEMQGSVFSGNGTEGGHLLTTLQACSAISLLGSVSPECPCSGTGGDLEHGNGLTWVAWSQLPFQALDQHIKEYRTKSISLGTSTVNILLSIRSCNIFKIFPVVAFDML